MLKDAIYQTVAWFKIAKPNRTARDFQVQLGVHFEEVSEMLTTLKGHDFTTQGLLDKARQATVDLANHLKAPEDKNGVIISLPKRERLEFLDALCDQYVTLVGCSYMADADITGAIDEVNRSNYSKFDDFGKPLYQPGGKVAKGPNYVKPNLIKYI